MSFSALAVLARSPRAGAERVLARPSVLLAFGLLVLATVTSTLVAARVGAEADINDLYFAGTRAAFVQAMIDVLGPQRTAVVMYLIQRSFDAVIVATAFSPLFYWLLGSTAVHAAARVAGVRKPFAPLLLAFAYATALTLVPANLATLLFGVGQGVGQQIGQLISVACLIWLLLIVHRTIQAHYEVTGERALRILIVAVVVFYLVPFVLIIAAAVAIIIAAVVLEYF